MTDGRPYEVLSPTKIRLGPEAKYWAKRHGMSVTEMARHLLQQKKLRAAGMSAADVIGTTEDQEGESDDSEIQ